MALLDPAQPVLGVAVAPSETELKVSNIRIPELDGFRGLMTLFVVYSHFFVEVPHGVGIFYFGWVAVIAFFVLSGYLVGRLIMEKKECRNFLPVFYLRRICRTFPTYFLASALLLLIADAIADRVWADGLSALPAWSYFVFAQNFFMLTRESVGLHWLAPSWTLALEEQFYIFAPLLFLLLPRRWWIAALSALCVFGLGLRAVGVFTGWLGLVPLGFLPSSADVLCIGVLLAVLVQDNVIDWQRWSGLLRVSPIVFLLLAAGAARLDGGEVGPWFQVLDPPLIAIASALFILMLVKGAPEARRFQSPLLRFFGDISYSVYLTHLLVLSLMHGFILGTEPDTATVPQILVSIAALPASIAVGWAMTRLLEQPITAWGRSFRWN
jgi:peptidoglycan/LPS O-acetylase OafA/YrhL